VVAMFFFITDASVRLFFFISLGNLCKFMHNMVSNLIFYKMASIFLHS
jgi:hypothetical protein